MTKTIEPNSKNLFQALGLAWELGYTIAIPLVVFALLGRLADKWLGSSPWLLLAGVFLSIAITTWLVYRKTKVFLIPTQSNDLDKNAEKAKDKSGENTS